MVSNFDLEYLSVPIFLAYLLQMASNSAFIRVYMIIRLPVKLVTLRRGGGGQRDVSFSFFQKVSYSRLKPLS